MLVASHTEDEHTSTRVRVVALSIGALPAGLIVHVIVACSLVAARCAVLATPRVGVASSSGVRSLYTSPVSPVAPSPD
jgi:hypothetical protein